MNFERLRNYGWSLAVAVTLVVSSGFTSHTLVQAQDRDRRENRREQRDDWRDSQRRDRDRDLDGDYDNYGRNDRNRNNGYNSRDEQKGFHDGLDRGREDARDNRIPTPNNSSHYRKGNDAYRAGFRHGYAQGYRQNTGYRRW